MEKQPIMNYDAIINQVNHMVPLSHSIHEILGILEDDSRSISDIIPIIRLDPNITTNILRFANSAFVARRQTVDSIENAVTFLGIQRIFEIALLSVSAAKFKKPQQGYGLKEGELWRHSAISALFAEMLARKFSLEKPNLIFTAALIKDIGKTILSNYLHEAAEKTEALISSKGTSFLDAEEQILGINHAVLGGKIAKRWNFPPKMVTLVRDHHLSAGEALEDPPTCIVYIADTICSMMGIGTGKDDPTYPFKGEALKHFQISPDQLNAIALELSTQMDQMKSFIDQF
jgi:putative nucleotidyltransferase with HDIG domain